MFITFEGIEGLGKTTHMNLIAARLQEKNIPFVLTREPGGTALGEELREILLAHRPDSVSHLTELLLMFAARAQHVDSVIKPALAKQQWVLCDRFVDATYAYQGGGRQIPLSQIDDLTQLVLGDFRPDIIFILDGDPKLGLQRACNRNANKLDRIETENVEFFERVRQAYLERAKQDATRYFVIDANRSIEVIQQELWTILKSVSHDL